MFRETNISSKMEDSGDRKVYLKIYKCFDADRTRISGLTGPHPQDHMFGIGLDCLKVQERVWTAAVNNQNIMDLNVLDHLFKCFNTFL